MQDRDNQRVVSEDFDAVFQFAGIQPLKLPSQSPNLNAFAQPWVRSVKDECLDQLILFGERSLRHALDEYLAHPHRERNHQGLENKLIRPEFSPLPTEGILTCRKRLGGILNRHFREAA